MNVNITGRHMDLSDDLKSSARSLCDQLSRYFDQINYANVVFDRENKRVKTEVIVSTIRGITLVGKAEDFDAFKSLDQAGDKIIRQLKKLKAKLNEKRDRSEENVSANPADRDRPGDTPPEEIYS